MRSKRITRTRYYCDHCEAAGRLKGFWTKPSIIKHERGCTINPNRICGLCAYAHETQKPIAQLVACLSTNKDDLGMKELRDLCSNCPACILAAIRQSGLQEWNEEGRVVDFGFNFKIELQEFWNTEREKARLIYEPIHPSCSRQPTATCDPEAGRQD